MFLFICHHCSRGAIWHVWRRATNYVRNGRTFSHVCCLLDFEWHTRHPFSPAALERRVRLPTCIIPNLNGLVCLFLELASFVSVFFLRSYQHTSVVSCIIDLLFHPSGFGCHSRRTCIDLYFSPSMWFKFLDIPLTFLACVILRPLLPQHLRDSQVIYI